jgi:hypothetical protein
MKPIGKGGQVDNPAWGHISYIVWSRKIENHHSAKLDRIGAQGSIPSQNQ